MTSGYAIATLVVFIISIFFAFRPVSIPTLRPIPRIPININTAPIFAIALLWVAECLDPAVIRKWIIGIEPIKPFNIIVLFFSLAYMAITLDMTGVLQAAAFWVSNKGGYNGRKLFLYSYIISTLLAILLGKDLATLSGTAFLVYYTEVTQFNFRARIMAEFAAANTACIWVLFVGNPKNVVICEGFSVNNVALTAHTILPFLACNLFCFVVLASQYPKLVPQKSTRAMHRDPRSAILDPIGAWVGSIMLGATLILCLVAGLFGIDAWMISLPFAFGKLLFDLGWDYYRYCHGIPVLGRGLSNAVGEGLDADFMVDEHPHTKDGPLRHPSPTDVELFLSFPPDEATPVGSAAASPKIESKVGSPLIPTIKMPHIFTWCWSYIDNLHDQLDKRFPTVITALPRLPFALVPFVFSQLILIEALKDQARVNVLADHWLVRASHNQVHPTTGICSSALSCATSGTNIDATSVLTEVVRAAALPCGANRTAAIAPAVFGAVNSTSSASHSC